MLVKENIVKTTIVNSNFFEYNNSKINYLGYSSFKDGEPGYAVRWTDGDPDNVGRIRGGISIYLKFSEPLIKGEKYFIRFKVKNLGTSDKENAQIYARIVDFSSRFDLKFGEEKLVEIYGEKIFDNQVEQIQVSNADPTSVDDLTLAFSDIKIVKGEKPDIVTPSNINVENQRFNIGGGNYSTIKSI